MAIEVEVVEYVSNYMSLFLLQIINLCIEKMLPNLFLKKAEFVLVYKKSAKNDNDK